MRRPRHAFLLGTLISALAATGAGAGEPGAQPETADSAEAAAVGPQRSRDWHLRFGLLAADTNGDTGVIVDPGSVDVSVSGGGGGFVSLERRVTPVLGVEFGLLSMGSDLDVSAGVGSKHHVGTSANLLAMSSLTLELNLHLLDGGPVDLYAGPMLAFNHYADMTLRTGVGGHWWPGDPDEWVTVRIREDSELSWGAKAGLDVRIGRKQRWSVGCSLAWIDATYHVEGERDEGSAAIDLDPLMFSFGGGFRF